MSFLLNLIKNMFSISPNRELESLNSEILLESDNINNMDKYNLPILKKCRYCYMDNNQKTFIAPCKCSGSIKFVHIYCLEKWKKIKHKSSYCEICNKRYKIPTNDNIINSYIRYYKSFILYCIIYGNRLNG